MAEIPCHLFGGLFETVFYPPLHRPHKRRRDVADEKIIGHGGDFALGVAKYRLGQETAQIILEIGEKELAALSFQNGQKVAPAVL